MSQQASTASNMLLHQLVMYGLEYIPHLQWVLLPRPLYWQMANPLPACRSQVFPRTQLQHMAFVVINQYCIEEDP